MAVSLKQAARMPEARTSRQSARPVMGRARFLGQPYAWLPLPLNMDRLNVQRTPFLSEGCSFLSEHGACPLRPCALPPLVSKLSRSPALGYPWRAADACAAVLAGTKVKHGEYVQHPLIPLVCMCVCASVRACSGARACVHMQQGGGTA